MLDTLLAYDLDKRSEFAWVVFFQQYQIGFYHAYTDNLNETKTSLYVYL